MDELPEGRPRIRIRPETVQRDVAAFGREQMRSTSKLMKRLKLKEADASELESELVRRSEGSFLWVTLAFDLLGRARGLTANKLKALVYRIPSGLNQIYDSMLNKLVEESEGGGRLSCCPADPRLGGFDDEAFHTG